MSGIENEAQAAEALFAAIQEEGGARSDVQALNDRVSEIKAENKSEVAAEGSEGTTGTDSFTNIDPSDLPPELQNAYKSLQADYTRKTQEVAEARKQYAALEDFGGVDAALEAVRFSTALATDPNYALEVHGQLTKALTEAGLTQEDASNVAAQKIVEASQEDEGFDEFEDSPVSKEVAALKAQVAEMAAWKQAQEDQSFEIALANEMARQENEILTANPDYSEDEIGDIYSLAYSTGGNLLQAQEIYKGMTERNLSKYLEKKGSVTAGVSGVQSHVQNAEVPHKFTGLYDPELEKVVNERLAQEIAAGNI